MEGDRFKLVFVEGMDGVDLGDEGRGLKGGPPTILVITSKLDLDSSRTCRHVSRSRSSLDLESVWPNSF